jgi:hypothetical protein
MKNLEIIQKYLNNERPYLIVQGGCEGKEHADEHKVGDVWTDDKGYVFERKRGYTVRSTRMGKIVKENLEKRSCKDCGLDIKWSNNKLDSRYYDIEGKCYECTLKFETRFNFFELKAIARK